MGKHVLVAGASGVVGFAALSHLASQGNCKVTAISRRAPLDANGVRFVSVDLANARSSAELAANLSDVTHVIYAALHEEPGLIGGWQEEKQIAANDRMLRNFFEPLEENAKSLSHVALLVGAAMNLIPAIGVWAALRKQAGKPLSFPGGANAILEAVDADLLARALAWAGEAPSARNQIFNVTNGDVFLWRNVWPVIAGSLGLEIGTPEPESLAKTLGSSAAAAAWDRIRSKYALAAPALSEFIGQSHYYADFCFAYGLEGTGGAAIVSTVKLRQAGFHDVIDTEDMFRRWFKWFQERRLLPPLPS